MHEPLLDRIHELEMANRRWKSLCAVLSVILLAVLIPGTAFVGYFAYQSVTQNRQAMLAAEEARLQEAVAREQAEVARRHAEKALQDAKQNQK